MANCSIWTAPSSPRNWTRPGPGNGTWRPPARRPRRPWAGPSTTSDRPWVAAIWGRRDDMAQVTIEVNGRAYTVGCEDGQERHLTELARLFDRQVRQVGQEVGQLGETRLFLMGALLLADELADMQVRL